MRRANGRESRFVGGVFRVVREQPTLRIFAAALVGGSMCVDEEIGIRSAKTPFGDLAAAQCLRNSERVVPRKGQRFVSRDGFVDEEQPDTPTLIIREGSADRQLALFPQSIRVCEVGRAGAGDLVQVSVHDKVDELHGANDPFNQSAESSIRDNSVGLSNPVEEFVHRLADALELT